MPEIPKHTIFPISDSALTIDFGNVISESINDFVLSLFQAIKTNPLAGMIEAVPSYSSLTLYYDLFFLRNQIPPGQTGYDWIAAQLLQRLDAAEQKNNISHGLITIPVCYEKEFAPDTEYLAREKNISVEELIHIHTSKQYRVYMLGFLPGFSYMGEVDERIAISRKSQPVTVAAGSIGIAGKQTGIYPLASPGGWQIIGRTPLKLFDAEKEDPVLLKAGDRVQFTSISKDEFKNY
ncbi:MAG TPA: 5-oxoprolinase subunit PxpB [Chitinophagaceae bacterium]